MAFHRAWYLLKINKLIIKELNVMDFSLVFRKIDLSKFADLISDKIYLRTHPLALSAMFFPPRTQPWIKFPEQMLRPLCEAGCIMPENVDSPVTLPEFKFWLPWCVLWLNTMSVAPLCLTLIWKMRMVIIWPVSSLLLSRLSQESTQSI